MTKLPDAVPCPEKPPLHLKGGYLCVASPLDLVEACFSVPAVRSLRHFRPQSTLAVICPESLEVLWNSVDELDIVITYPNKASSRRIAKILEEIDVTFESAIAWEAGEVAMAFARAGILQRLGYPAAGLEKYLTDTVEVAMTPGPVSHRVRHYLNFVKKLGSKAFVPENFQTPPLAPAPKSMRVALSPSSEYGESFLWPLERFVEVVEVMESRHEGIEWVIMETGRVSGKRDVCAELENMLDEKAVKYVRGESGYGDVIKELPQCSVLLACDGEVAHLAAHVGLPSVVIFGPNEPEWKRPLGKQSRVLREHVACSPCYLARCPLDHRCQNEVTVEMALAGLGETLSLR